MIFHKQKIPREISHPPTSIGISDFWNFFLCKAPKSDFFYYPHTHFLVQSIILCTQKELEQEFEFEQFLEEFKFNQKLIGIKGTGID